MGATVWGAGLLLPPAMPHWQFLAIQVPLGIASYLALVAGLKLNAWLEVRRVLSEIFAGRLKPFVLLLRRHGFMKGNTLAE
jgi:hypothetical protein